MGYQANYFGRTFAKGTKALARARATGEDGVMRCPNCTKPVTRAAIEYDHIVPWEFSHYSGPSNCQILCCDCHAVKTAGRDVPAIAKNNRLRKRHAGGKRKPRHPFPCGRASAWSKPIGALAPVARVSRLERLREVLARRAILAQRQEA